MDALLVAVIVMVPGYFLIRETFRRYVSGQLSAHMASLVSAAVLGCLALAPAALGLTALDSGYALICLFFAVSGYIAGRAIAALAPRKDA